MLENLGIAPIEDKMRENCLKQFGQVYGRPEKAVVSRSDGIQTTSKKKNRESKENLVRDD